jgi:formylglycine-generating enzyme required for sulfatase activity
LSPSSVAAGNGRWGQADLAGNVYEWVQDWYVQPYPLCSHDCANLMSGSYRVIRGGSYYEQRIQLATTDREIKLPDSRDGEEGVRCARTP